MFLIREINPLSFRLLERIYRQSRHHQVRQRAHLLILVCQGVKLEELIKIFPVSYKTIYNWINRWESEGILGLYNKPVRGCKRTFNPSPESIIREWARQDPRQLKKVLQKIKSEWGIEVSKYCVINNCGAGDAPPPVRPSTPDNPCSTKTCATHGLTIIERLPPYGNN